MHASPGPDGSTSLAVGEHALGDGEGAAASRETRRRPLLDPSPYSQGELMVFDVIGCPPAVVEVA